MTPLRFDRPDQCEPYVSHKNEDLDLKLMVGAHWLPPERSQDLLGPMGGHWRPMGVQGIKEPCGWMQTNQGQRKGHSLNAQFGVPYLSYFNLKNIQNIQNQ